MNKKQMSKKQIRQSMSKKQMSKKQMSMSTGQNSKRQYNGRIVRVLIYAYMIVGVDGRSSGRRRRRNMYNDRPCGPGEKAVLSYSKNTVVDCVSCGAGEYRSDSKHSSESCNVCEGGRHSGPDFTYCLGDICTAGYLGVKDVVGCSMCAIGKYSPKTGAFGCMGCESGRYNTNTGMDTCLGTMCPGGKYGLAEETTYANSGVCHVCPAGKMSRAGYSLCVDCPKGTYSDYGAAKCSEHESCTRIMYPVAEPTVTSSVVLCESCIRASDIYFSGYLFASTVAILNTMLFIANRTKYCYAMLFAICPGVWALVLRVCLNKPSNVPAIISIAMNLMCLSPVWGVIKQKYREVNDNRVANNNGCGAAACGAACGAAACGASARDAHVPHAIVSHANVGAAIPVTCAV